MGLFGTIFNTVKKVGVWAAKNPETAMFVVEKLGNKKPTSTTHTDRALVMEQRVNQLNEKVEKQEKKILSMEQQILAMGEQIRCLKIWLTVTGVALAVAVAAVAVFAFLL